MGLAKVGSTYVPSSPGGQQASFRLVNLPPRGAKITGLFVEFHTEWTGYMFSRPPGRTGALAGPGS